VNRKVILLNVVLLALAGWLFWMLRMKWVELHQHEHTVLALSPAVRQRLAPPSPMAVLQPMKAGDYNEVAQKMLFSKDRNPNVIVDPPAPPPPPPAPPPMPELPSFYGTMALFGDPVILLKLPKGTQKQYHAGDQVGPFKLVRFDRDTVVFDWEGKIVERNPADLKEKESAPQVAAAAPPPPPPTVNTGGVRTGDTDSAKVSDKLGKDNGGGVRQCVPGDPSPAGTIIDGYKKKIVTNMFGATCMWEQVNP
jgi:hypothetical protein